MKARGFTNIRKYLGKTQRQVGRLLCVFKKSIQSHEQGWREIPANIERQLLFLPSLKRIKEKKTKPCWGKQNVLLNGELIVLPGSFRPVTTVGILMEHFVKVNNKQIGKRK